MRVRKYSISSSLLIREALKKGLNCAFLPEKVVAISDQHASHYFRGTKLPCNNTVASQLAGNKYFLRRLLKKEKLPTPRTIILRHPTAWPVAMQGSLQFPLVVKPINASHANGTAVNITSPHELKHAVKRAFSYIKKNRKENRVLIEEYFAGHDLRFLVVGNRVVSVVKREPASIIGDGQSTIRQLIHSFNNQWHSPFKYDLPLCPIPLDSEVSRYLKKHGLTLKSVLPENLKSYVRWNANVSTGGQPHDVTDLIHPELKQLAVQVAKLSQLEIGGVDMLCKNIISNDISANNISILEINDAPGFDIHHFPVTGPGQNVAGDILDHIFKIPHQTKEFAPDRIESLLNDIQIMHSPSTRQRQTTSISQPS